MAETKPRRKKLPSKAGFTFERAKVVLVTCDECGDWELTYGEFEVGDAANWAKDHAALHADNAKQARS